MKILSWPIGAELKKETEDHYRTGLGSGMKDADILSIVRTLTFDGVAPRITIDDCRDLVRLVSRDFARFRGVGIELGAGSGFFTALLAEVPGVTRAYGVEVCESVVRDLMEKTVRGVSPAHESKVVGCIGDFSDLRLPDGSADFMFDFFSLHHSRELGETLKESLRVLRPGGFAACLDKARSNALSDADLERLLDREYPDSAKRIMGVDPSVRLTRRMNGENEYRLDDWRAAFLGAGFSRFEHFHLARVDSSNPLLRLAKRACALLPGRFQSKASSIFPSFAGNRNDLEGGNRVFVPALSRFPKEISLMIAWK